MTPLHIDHHSGARAIAMAELARSKDEHAEVRELAEESTRPQQAEIETTRRRTAVHH